MNGKGDTPRPVNRKKYETNFSKIEWKSKRTPFREFLMPIYEFVSYGNCHELRGGRREISFDGTLTDLRRKRKAINKLNKQAWEKFSKAEKGKI